MKERVFLYTKEIAFLVFLLAFVLVVNIPAISYSMVYIEQAPIYLANQQVTSLLDLLNVYLHPHYLYEHGISFFRPSGHFLMYQLLTPFLGWHNLKGLITVNLLFLALSGYLMIKVYKLLFPRFIVGGYLAFSLYLMHPALLLPRLMVEHFDFAYLFFTLLSLYFFMIFCRRNIDPRLAIKQLRFGHFYLLILSLVFFAIAATFKESAIVLGTVLSVYFLISLYHTATEKFLRQLTSNNQIVEILVLLGVVSLALALYLSNAWGPLINHRLTTMGNPIQYLMYIVGPWQQSNHLLNAGWWLAGGVIFPLFSRLLLCFFCFIAIINLYFIYTNKMTPSFNAAYKKSVSFIIIACLLFLLLPTIYAFTWQLAYPWHLSLSLMFICLLMGFSFESTFQFIQKQWLYFIGTALALLIGASSAMVTYANINYKGDRAHFVLALHHNAIYAPPDIKNKLNNDSVLVVEDSQSLGNYFIGDSFKLNSSPLYPQNQVPFLKNQPVYNGMLFRWAYLLPGLKEQTYPFKIAKMGEVPDKVISMWLQHYNNIYCLGYDNFANWHDETTAFKQQLLLQQHRRHMLPSSIA